MCRYLSIALGPLVESDKPRERAGLGGVQNMEGGWDAGQSESLSKATLAALSTFLLFEPFHFTLEHCQLFDMPAKQIECTDGVVLDRASYLLDHYTRFYCSRPLHPLSSMSFEHSYTEGPVTFPAVNPCSIHLTRYLILSAKAFLNGDGAQNHGASVLVGITLLKVVLCIALEGFIIEEGRSGNGHPSKD